jgi:hypothetical protein
MTTRLHGPDIAERGPAAGAGDGRPAFQLLERTFSILEISGRADPEGPRVTSPVPFDCPPRQSIASCRRCGGSATSPRTVGLTGSASVPAHGVGARAREVADVRALPRAAASALP